MITTTDTNTVSYDDICTLAPNGFCERHELIHVKNSRSRELCLARTEAGWKHRQLLDRQRDGKVFNPMMVPGKFDVGVGTPDLMALQQMNFKALAARARANADRPEPPGYGPGTQLLELMKIIGAKNRPNCTCVATALAMDLDGVEGCRKNFDVHLKAIQDNAEDWGWTGLIMQYLSSGIKAIANGIFLNPLRPFHGLINLAIKREEERIQKEGLEPPSRPGKKKSESPAQTESPSPQQGKEEGQPLAPGTPPTGS